MAKFGVESAKGTYNRINAWRDAIRTYAQHIEVRPSIVAAIISRETLGDPKYFIGDNGHGCGPMQVDDRSDPEFCKGYKTKVYSDEQAIERGCLWLQRKIQALSRMQLGLAPDALMRAAIAAYNCGEGNVCKAIQAGQDVDVHTTNGNYSKDVLERASFFLSKGFDA